MRINNHIQLNELQTGFSKSFPGMKLEFIFNGSEKLNLASRLSHSFPYVSIQELCPDCPGEGLNIDETMTTRDVEVLLQSYLHLPANIFVSIDGYWQKNKMTETLVLKDYDTISKKINKEDSSFSQD